MFSPLPLTPLAGLCYGFFDRRGDQKRRKGVVGDRPAIESRTPVEVWRVEVPELALELLAGTAPLKNSQFRL